MIWLGERVFALEYVDSSASEVLSMSRRSMNMGLARLGGGGAGDGFSDRDCWSLLLCCSCCILGGGGGGRSSTSSSANLRLWRVPLS